MAEMEILGAKISDYDMVETVCSAAALIDVGRQAGKGEPMLHQIVTLNAEILYKAQTDARLMEIINQAELVTPDGSGIVMAAQKLCNPLLLMKILYDGFQSLPQHRLQVQLVYSRALPRLFSVFYIAF